MKRLEGRAGAPAEALLAIFDVLAELQQRREFRGCAFINACAEYGDRDSPIHSLAAEHKRLILAYVRKLAEAAGARDPQGLARQLCILMDGVIVTAQVSGDMEAVRSARDAAELLVREATLEAG